MYTHISQGYLDKWTPRPVAQLFHTIKEGKIDP